MAVAIDVTGTELLTASAASPRTYAGLTTGGSLSNGAVTFIVTYNIQATASAATWDGVACTLIIGANMTGGGRVELWGLSPIGAHTGAKTFSVSWSGGAAQTIIQGLSWTGVNQTGGTTTFNTTNSATGNNAGPATVNIVSQVGDAVLADFITDNAGHFVATNNTQLFVDNTPTSYCAAGNRAAGAGSVTMSCTVDAVTGWTVAVANILAAGAVTPATILWHSPWSSVTTQTILIAEA